MLPVIIGATAVGKSAVAMELAKKINGEIISCDSRQIYKYMDIATAKPSVREQKEVAHHLIDVIEPNEEYSAARWVEDCGKSIELVRKNGKIPIICGGTFFYLDALRFGFDVSSPQNAELREEFLKIRDTYGSGRLYKILLEKNPKRALNLHPNDEYRIVRALQIASGEPEVLQKSEEKFAVFVLSCRREILYNMINERVDLMLQKGLFEEYKFICRKYPDKNVSGRNCVGYREFDDFCDGKKTFDECVEKIKQHSRNFAKRQTTWIKNRESQNFFIDVEKYSWDAQKIAEAIGKLYFIEKQGV